MFSRRLQVQERLTHQVADTIKDSLDPIGVAVVMEGRHLCKEGIYVCRCAVLQNKIALLQPLQCFDSLESLGRPERNF